MCGQGHVPVLQTEDGASRVCAPLRMHTPFRLCMVGNIETRSVLVELRAISNGQLRSFRHNDAHSRSVWAERDATLWQLRFIDFRKDVG
jgi:hypothetical protein